MTDFKAIFENEAKRTSSEEIRKIYLYPEGNFIRAFNWSAYLWCTHIKQFKPIIRKVKETGESAVQIGCPIASYVGHMPEGATQLQNPDGSVVVTLPDTLIGPDTDIAATAAQVDKWIKECQEQEPTKRKRFVAEPGSQVFETQPRSITEVMQRILTFPVEKKSMIECVTFLSDIKIQLARLI